MRGKITVFLYHPDRLEAFFSKESVQALLHEIGYTDTNLKQVLPVFRAHYQQYLREKKVFPHEMGLLLGYPPEDVKGFIRNQGKNYLYSGYWKVYDRPHEKIRLFKKYEHSREKTDPAFCHMECALKRLLRFAAIRKFGSWLIVTVNMHHNIIKKKRRI